MPSPGDTLGGKYQLLRLLGEGGMGQVFEARNLNTGRRVAIKTLHSRFNADSGVVQRFLREARAATTVEHPNVVDVLDLDHDAKLDIPYIVQEYLVGESLEAHLHGTPGRGLPVAEVMQIAVPVMRALRVAHQKSVVHRDLKPANIFLTRDASDAFVPKVIDFGIAKLLSTQPDGQSQTQTGATIGTPDYMSPEQAAGTTDLDARTDIWSIAVVLYEMLSGALPFDAPSANLVMVKIVRDPPVPLLSRDPSLPGDLVAVVERGLQKNPDDRFGTMQEMLAATLACQVGTVAAPASQPPAPVPFPVRPAMDEAVTEQGVVAIVKPPAQPSLVSWSGSQPGHERSHRGRYIAAAVGVLVVVAITGVLSLRKGGERAAQPANARPPTAMAATAPMPAPTPIAMPEVVPTVGTPEVAPSRAVAVPAAGTVAVPTDAVRLRVPVTPRGRRTPAAPRNEAATTPREAVRSRPTGLSGSIEREYP